MSTPDQARDRDNDRPPVSLGCFVSFKVTSDIVGRVVDHTKYIDGTERFGVEYWHNGERKNVNARGDELEWIR